MVVMLLSFFSCGGKKTDVTDAITERDSLPMMSSYGVETFMSDSGIIRYKVITEEWLVYDKKNPPYWAFEKAVYLEKFDTLLNVEFSVRADTAYYFEKSKLWKLIGNVEIQNTLGEKFETELLFWNQATERVYSDKFIRIEQIDRIITGHGFDSNQQMTEYEIKDMGGILYFDESPTVPPPSPDTEIPPILQPTDSIN